MGDIPEPDRIRDGATTSEEYFTRCRSAEQTTPKKKKKTSRCTHTSDQERTRSRPKLHEHHHNLGRNLRASHSETWTIEPRDTDLGHQQARGFYRSTPPRNPKSGIICEHAPKRDTPDGHNNTRNTIHLGSDPRARCHNYKGTRNAHIQSSPSQLCQVGDPSDLQRGYNQMEQEMDNAEANPKMHQQL